VYNLSIFLEDSARRYPDRDALVLGDVRLSYAQVDAMANRVANLLVELGVSHGDRVALTCPNVPHFAVIYYGILKAGAVVVPLNVLNKGREVAYYLDDSEAKAYFCFEGTPELPMAQEGYAGVRDAAGSPEFIVVTADPASPSPIEGTRTLGQALHDASPVFESVLGEETDTAVILYTSGTTGQPKGAELSHSNLVLNALTCNRLFGSTPGTDVHLLTLPLFHSFGSTVQLNSGFSMGATLVLLPRFDADAAISLLQSEDVTFFAGVPTMWWGLLGSLENAHGSVDVARIAANLRIGVSGGASLPVEIIKDVKEKLGVTVLEGYGLSETSPVATFSDPARDPRPGSIGVPIWGVECKLIADDWSEVEGPDAIGEIAIRGHNVMKGYLNRPEATAEVMLDGWFRTGDLARRDEDGYYYIVDRSKDMIIRGGYNVYPRELEEVLMEHPAVSLVAVIGVPHESHGEEIKAVVVKNKDHDDVSEDDLVAWGKEQFASYKYPRIVEFRDELPMTSTGKILKRELS
jgi:long-chain acyl-CoA synthetase